MLKSLLNIFRTTFLDPLKEFIHDSRAIGITLLVCTFLSLLAANLIGNSYISFWNIHIPFSEELHLTHTLLHFINDGLMAVFFFLVGMEIRRELISGELSSFKKSLLPIVAAIGGMAMPAFIYLLLNGNTDMAKGWGVPTATDIAFSLGVASLLGSRVPVALKIFLTALAIIDDLGAILVIALFYGGSLKLIYLIAAAIIAAITLLIKTKTRRPGFTLPLLGIALWYCMLNSGIHATIAGVIFAFLIPSRHLSRLEIKLHHPVYFFIMPVFALANTAIIFPANALTELSSNMSWGIMLGLFLGKPLGISLISFLLVKTGLVSLPQNTGWLQLIGAGILAGIGFTMSIFIATLAFDAAHADIAKVAVLIASVMSMLIGYIWLRLFSKPAYDKA